MDPLRYKRPETKNQRQITKTTFGNPQFVPRVISTRPQQFVNATLPAVRSRGPVLHSSVRRTDGMTMGRMAVESTHPEPTSTAALTPTPALVTASAPVAAARSLPIDMNLPGQDSPVAFSAFKHKASRRKLRRGASRGMAVAVVLVITMGGLLFSQSYLKVNKVFKGGAETAAALKADVKPELLKGEGRGRINVLLLGRGGGNHTAPDLTDTLMLVSIDPVNRSSTLVSIPRDLWVNVSNQGVMKLNAAWQSGVFKYIGKQVNGTTDRKAIAAGFESVDKTIEDVLGLTIDYNVMLDFQAFKQAVDTVGGVSVNVPADLVDPTMAWENANNPVLAKAGIQNFDGTQALIYSRSRETTSDFARSERQRAMLVALKSKVASVGTLSNPLKLSGLMSAFSNNIQTDLSINNATRLYSILKGVSDTKVSSVGFADESMSYLAGGNINGQSVVLPKAGLFKYDAIKEYLRAQLKDPYIVKENARIMVLNGTMLPGLASTKGDELKSYGYNVTNIGNTPNSGWTQTTLIDLTHKNKYTKNYLEQRFGIKAASSLTDKTIPTNGADFAIIIGSDQTPITKS